MTVLSHDVEEEVKGEHLPWMLMIERSDLDEAQGSNDDALVFGISKFIKNIVNAKYSMAKDSLCFSRAIDSIKAQY